MDISAVRSVLVSAGYQPASLTAIQEGSNHDVFDVLLEDGRSVICKFAKVRHTELGIAAANTDTLFGGRLSLDREAHLLSMAKEQGGLPVPKVFGTHDSPLGKFIMVEKCPGISFTASQKAHGYRLDFFLSSLRALGADFGKLHRNIQFSSFGNIMSDCIEPGTANFADRFLSVTEMRIDRAVRKGTFTPAETEQVRSFFHSRFEELRPRLTVEAAPPVMVFTDMHGENFFVDENGVPSGYFDLESSQAAPAALEFYGFRFFLFTFYDQETFAKAEEAFFSGYRAAGGPFAPKDDMDDALIRLLAGCRLLELAQSYWGYVDGIRDNWAQEMKDLLFQYMERDVVDYSALGAIWRERDGQPAHHVL